MRLSAIVTTYLIIGVVMFGGGAISINEIGVADTFVDFDEDQGSFEAEQNISSNVEDTDGIIDGVINTFGGPMQVAWDLASSAFMYLNWPIFALAGNDVPPIVTFILGVPLTASFYLSLAGMVLGSS